MDATSFVAIVSLLLALVNRVGVLGNLGALPSVPPERKRGSRYGNEGYVPR